MRRYILTLLMATVILAGCVAPVTQNAQGRDVTATARQMDVYSTNQPIPQFQFSQDRDTLIQIYRLRNDARLTYTYVSGINGGRPQWSCPSRGYALAADTQLTNPSQLAGQYVPTGRKTTDGSSSSTTDGTGNYITWVTGVIDLPEPNGLYSSKNTDGTWVLCVRPDGTINPVYTELKVQTFPFEMRWDPEQQMLVDGGQKSTSTIEIKAAR